MLNENCKRFVAEVYLGEVNKPTTQNTREANDFVHAKRLARKKRLLPGYYCDGVYFGTQFRDSNVQLMLLRKVYILQMEY